MLNRASFKKVLILLKVLCKNPLSVPFAFFPNRIPSLHVLDTEDCFLSENIKNVFMPNALRFRILRSADGRMCCSVVFYLSPPDNFI